MNLRKLLLVLCGIIIVYFVMTANVQAKGYTGQEINHTQVYDKNYISGVTVLRSYKEGLFVDVELFNGRDPDLGVGYQYGDKDSIVDFRVNEQNVKLFIMQRFNFNK